MKKAFTCIISLMMTIIMAAGILIIPGTVVNTQAVTWFVIDSSGNEGFNKLRTALEGSTYTYIKLNKTIEADVGFNTHYDPIKITTQKVLDLNGHSIVLDNCGNADRKKIVAGQYYSPNTIAKNSNSSMFEINDDGYGNTCGNLTVMNSGSSYDEYSPLDDKTPAIKHTGFPVGNPEDYYSKHYKNYCVRNVFDVVNGALKLDGNFAVVAGSTKTQDEGSNAHSILTGITTTIGFGLNVAQTVMNITSGGAAGAAGAAASAASSAGGNAGTADTNTGAQSQAPASAPSELSTDGSASGGKPSEGGSKKASGNTVQANLNSLAGKDATTISNFTEALYEIFKPLDTCKQVIWGSCVNVGADASVVINGGKFYGHGQSDSERDAVITGAKKSVIQITDGEFYGMAGADILNVDVQSNTTIKGGTFECFSENVIRLVDKDNKTTTYPGTVGATGISSDMLDGSLISDGRMMIKAKVLPSSKLSAERNAIQALESAADNGAANTLQSQANLVTSKVVIKNNTTKKWEIMDDVCLPLSSFVEICPNYGITSGCTDSLWMENSKGATGTISYTTGLSSLINLYGTDYYSNSYIGSSSAFGGSSRTTSGIITSEEINPITNEPYKTIKSIRVGGATQSFYLSSYCPEAGKTYRITFTRLDSIKIPGTENKTLTDSASTELFVKAVKSSSAAYTEKLKFTTPPTTKQKAVVNLDAINLNATYNGAKEFSVSYEWWNATSNSKITTTTTNEYSFASYGGKNVYCIAKITPTAAGKKAFPNFTSLTAKTDTVSVSAPDSKPIIVEQSGDQTIPTYRDPDEIYINVMKNEKEFFGYQWEFRTDDKDSWNAISTADFSFDDFYQTLNTDGKAVTSTGAHKKLGKADYVSNFSGFQYNETGVYQLNLKLSGLKKDTDYQFRCTIKNPRGTTYSEVIKIRHTEQVMFGSRDLYNGETPDYEGVSYNSTTNTLTLDNFDDSVNTQMRILKSFFINSRYQYNTAQTNILSTLDNLNIELIGDNYIFVDDTATGAFVYSTGNITFKGSGNLTVVFNQDETPSQIKCICAKNVTFSCSGTISFTINDYSNIPNGEYWDDDDYNGDYPVSSDKVTINDGTLEFKMLRKSGIKTRMKYINTFVKYDSGITNHLVEDSYNNTTIPSDIIKPTFSTTGGTPRLYYGSSEKSALVANGSSAVITALSKTATKYDYVKLSMISDKQAYCKHVEGDTLEENTVAPTCTKEGSCQYVVRCAKCDAEMSRTSAVLPKTDHDYDSGRVVSAATTTSSGTIRYTCNVCGTKKTASIAKIDAVSISKTSMTYDGSVQKPTVKAVDSKGTTLKKDKDYTVSYSKDCKNAGTYTVTVTFKGKYSGTVKKTFKITAQSMSGIKVSVAKSAYTYTGKEIKPTVTVKDSKGKVVDSANYTVTYKNNKAVGKATVTVKLKGNYSGSGTASFKINPTATSLSTVTAGKKAFTAKWSKNTSAAGYELQYSTSANFTAKTTKTVKITSASTVTKTVSKLTGGKKYYVQIRAYKTVDKVTYYSAWSAAKKVTPKK